MDDILEYCSMTWGVTFPVFDKVRVNGKKASPLYRELTKAADVVVELDARDQARPRVTRAVAAVDVGRPVNPRGLEAQMQGALVDALSVTLQAGVHIYGGAVRESSYTDFRYARLRDRVCDVEHSARARAPG